MSRDERLFLRVSRDELAAFQAAADKHALGISTWARAMLVRAARRALAGDTLPPPIRPAPPDQDPGAED